MLKNGRIVQDKDVYFRVENSRLQRGELQSPAGQGLRSIFEVSNKRPASASFRRWNHEVILCKKHMRVFAQRDHRLNTPPISTIFCTVNGHSTTCFKHNHAFNTSVDAFRKPGSQKWILLTFQYEVGWAKRPCEAKRPSTLYSYQAVKQDRL